MRGVVTASQTFLTILWSMTDPLQFRRVSKIRQLPHGVVRSVVVVVVVVVVAVAFDVDVLLLSSGFEI